MFDGGHLEGMNNLVVAERVRTKKGALEIQDPQRENHGATGRDVGE